MNETIVEYRVINEFGSSIGFDSEFIEARRYLGNLRKDFPNSKYFMEKITTITTSEIMDI